MKGDHLHMKKILKAIGRNFAAACEAYYNTYVRL